MNQEQYQQLSRWINAHADGLLDEKQRHTFEQAKTRNAAIRAELSCQAKLDDSLRRAYAPPPADAILARIAGSKKTSPPGQSKISPWIWRLAIVAAVLVLGVGGWWAWLMWQDNEAPILQQKADLVKQTVGEVYESLVAGGFKPRWACKDEKDFVSTFQMKLGQGLVFEAAPAGVAMVGLSYADCLSASGVVFLADVKGEKVIVIADRLGNDTKPKLPDGSKLHLFRRRVGRLVLYEVSPLDKKSLLDYFHKKDLPVND